MSYALQNIKKYQGRQKKELEIKILYHTAEAITALLIFAFGLLVIGMGN